jgi:phosphate transport system substrate-binding protein
VEPLLIGEYRLIARLGRGGMSDVFLALRHGQLGFTKLVVVKCLRDDLIAGLEEHDFSPLLLDEARVCARLQHPNIVQTFEAGLDAGRPFIAMEYLEGQSLDRVLGALSRENARLPQEITLRVLCDVLSALEYAHSLCDFDGSPLGLVHRDVSPHNIFLTYQGEVKLVDFGVAKHAWSSEQTEVGIVKGKLTYMAPEQAQRAQVDHRADLFASAIVLWECLTMRRLLAADNPAATLAKLLYEPIPTLLSVRPDAEPALSELCARALEREPAQRFPDAAALRLQLEAAASGRIASRAELARYMSERFARERELRNQHIQKAVTSEHFVNLAAAISGDDQPTLATSLSQRYGTQRRSLTGQTPIAVAAPARRDVPSSASIALVVLAMCVSIGSIWWARHATQTPAPALSLPQSGHAALVPEAGGGMEAETVLRLCGSNTIGAELAPALVEAFLADRGASRVTRHRGARTDLTAVTASFDNKQLSIEIAANGSATAFSGLASGVCDVGMASRAIEESEAATLVSRGLGDVRLPGAEHVIALDGIAVVVHPSNRLRALDRATLHDIYAGKVDNWAALGGKDAPIHVLSRDGKSGTFDTFKHLVLGKDALTSRALLFGENDTLSDKVASDPDAIGFVGLAYVRAARALAVSEPGTPPMLPTQFTVATEGYMLSRRLYLYTLPKPRTPWISELVSFALSQRAQAVTSHSGFVDLGVTSSQVVCDAHCSSDYATSVANAERISLDFRFRPGSNEPDSRAARDLDRLVSFMRDHPHAKLRLLGFADAIGSTAINQKLSLERARTIANELRMRGIQAPVVKGLGSQMPVASNESESGKQRNRRVEVWVELQ